MFNAPIKLRLCSAEVQFVADTHYPYLCSTVSQLSLPSVSPISKLWTLLTLHSHEKSMDLSVGIYISLKQFRFLNFEKKSPYFHIYRKISLLQLF